MKHVVRRPFTWCPDGSGVTEEALQPGDARDFRDMATGLLAEGYIDPETTPAVEPVKPQRRKA